jgi:Domain of unknown function (DUF1963)
MHDRFDLEKWIAEFPLRKRKDFPCGPTLTSPSHVAVVEQQKRRAIEKGLSLGKPVPIDLCVWNWGESPTREVTKIGGLPFWPASRSWPVDKTHGPMTFIAQFWFADSTDIRSPLPGDALLIFGNDSNFYEGLQFEWVSRTSDPLIDPSDTPPPKWPIQPCFASLLRTFEYPDADRKAFGREFPLSDQARGGSGTKIGGIVEEYDYTIHLWSEEDLELIPSAREEHEAALRSIEHQKTKGPLLCRLESLSTAYRWPFLNIPERTWRFTGDANLLMIYDAGAMAIFLSDKNKLSYELSSG